MPKGNDMVSGTVKSRVKDFEGQPIGKAIQKEMSAVKVAFKILDDDDKPPIGSQYMKCHMVFSIKMEDFSRKAHLVAGGHMVEAPK